MSLRTKNIFFLKWPRRYALLAVFILVFLILSFFTRLILLFWSFSEVSPSLLTMFKTFFIGFLFDIGTISFFAIPYIIYLLIVPAKWYGNWVDKIITYMAYGLGLIILIFSFFAEITFWDEFKTRFNFIAVDYLVYTYEVVKNINESYSVPLLLSGVILVLAILIIITEKTGAFRYTFNNDTLFKDKILPSVIIISVALIFGFFVTNQQAEKFENRYNNEIAKTGIYSFFAAFKNNDLQYTEFYNTIEIKNAFATVKKSLNQGTDHYIIPDKNLIFRNIINSDSLNKPQKPNVILICIESLSGEFLTAFGNKESLTPVLDTLGNNSVFFNNLYATGTRTVRGMEAITLSIPPTPGSSIVKRKENQGLFTIGEIFKQQGYERTFFYGGDGYFDNMNNFFGGNGFNIVDRGRGFLMDNSITTARSNIEDNEVTFENAWGVCDGDIYNKVISEADITYLTGKPFFNFIMTTSNHKPYTYPENKIDIPSGSGRNGAVKYTDFAIGEFLKSAKTKPWFKNTVFVIMADHCANSAGRWEINIDKYHIPAMIYNLKNTAPMKLDALCSQIDVMPTLFALLNWDYSSNLFGENVLKMHKEDERAFIGNYRKLGLLKDRELMILGDQQEVTFYKWNTNNNDLILHNPDPDLLNETISFYQTADFLYRNKGLQLKELDLDVYSKSE